MIYKRNDPEYDRLVERFIAVCTFFVFFTIGLSIWKIGETLISF
jgi:hypothetical protein